MIKIIIIVRLFVLFIVRNTTHIIVGYRNKDTRGTLQVNSNMPRLQTIDNWFPGGFVAVKVADSVEIWKLCTSCIEESRRFRRVDRRRKRIIIVVHRLLLNL